MRIRTPCGHLPIALCLLLSLACKTALATDSIMGGGPFYNAWDGYGDCESDWDGNGLVDGWETFATLPSGFTLAHDRSIFSSGAGSQRVTAVLASAAGSEAYRFHLQEWLNKPTSSLSPGSRVRFGFSMRTSASPTNLKFRASIEYGAGGTTLGAHVFLPETPLLPNTTWTTHTAEFQVPSNAQWVRLVIRIGVAGAGPAAGSVWIDDATLTDGRPPVKPKKYTIRNWALYPYNISQYGLLMMEKYEGGRFEYNNSHYGLQKVRPDGEVMLITRISYTTNLSTRGYPDDVFAWREFSVDHPDWILRDQQNYVISYNHWVAVDLGNPAYQQQWLSRMLAYLQRMKITWLFFDAVDAHAEHSLNNKLYAKYPTDAQWQAAVTSFLQAVMPSLHAAGVKVMLNMAHTSWYAEPGRTWMSLVDGMVYEFGFVNNDPGLLQHPPYSSWRQKFFSRATAPPENPELACPPGFQDKVFAIADRAALNDAAARRFGMASYLCCMNANSLYVYCTTVESQVWHSDLEVPLGDPTEPYRIVAGDIVTGGLFKRAFQNGLVLCNPHDTQSFQFTLTDRYVDLDGRPYNPGTVTVTPKQGLILLKAPNLRLTLTATPNNPKPGDVVTYSLLVANVGTLQANNPVIRLPIPANMELVPGSIGGGGSYDAEARSVAWQFGLIYAGTTQTLTCRARVK